jgi:hypothetical protein
MGKDDKDELIKEHARIKLTEIDVTRRLQLSAEQARDETTIRRFISGGTPSRTLPDMIEIEVLPYPDDDPRYMWHVDIYEQPNNHPETEPA